MKSARRLKERLKDATTISVGSYQVNPFLYWRSWLTILTPFVLAAIPLSLGDAGSENESEDRGYSREEALWTLYTILVMAVFWIFELLPLPITSLLPLVLLPLAGVASTDEVARNYLKVSSMWSGHVTPECAGDQHDVCLQSDHGHSGGALRPPPQGGAQDH